MKPAFLIDLDQCSGVQPPNTGQNAQQILLYSLLFHQRNWGYLSLKKQVNVSPFSKDINFLESSFNLSRVGHFKEQPSNMIDIEQF